MLERYKLKTLFAFLLFIPLLAEENWYTNFIFKNESFKYEFIRTLGYTVTGGADLGEGVATARAIQDGDIYSWRDQWLKTAQRIEKLAEKMETQGQVISAQEAYLRASNYYRTAGFFLVASQDRRQSVQIWEKGVDCFDKAICSLSSNSRFSMENQQIFREVLS